MAAKGAEAAARADAAKAAQAQAAAPPKLNAKAKRSPELRGNISVINGVKQILWLKHKENVNYTGLSDHCARKHPVDGPATEKDEGADRPGHRAAGAGSAVAKEGGQKSGARTSPKGPYWRSGDTEYSGVTFLWVLLFLPSLYSVSPDLQ